VLDVEENSENYTLMKMVIIIPDHTMVGVMIDDRTIISVQSLCLLLISPAMLAMCRHAMDVPEMIFYSHIASISECDSMALSLA
jgi:hypothetical protein